MAGDDIYISVCDIIEYTPGAIYTNSEPMWTNDLSGQVMVANIRFIIIILGFHTEFTKLFTLLCITLSNLVVVGGKMSTT